MKPQTKNNNAARTTLSIKRPIIISCLTIGLFIITDIPYLVAVLAPGIITDEGLATAIGLLYFVPLLLGIVASIVGIFTFIIALKRWRGITKVSKIWAIVIVFAGLVAGLVGLVPLIDSAIHSHDYTVQSMYDIQASYVSYDVAKSDILSCKIMAVNVNRFGVNSGEQDQYIRLFKDITTYPGYPSAYYQQQDAHGEDDAISYPVKIIYKNDVSSDIAQANNSCPTQIKFVD